MALQLLSLLRRCCQWLCSAWWIALRREGPGRPPSEKKDGKGLLGSEVEEVAALTQQDVPQPRLKEQWDEAGVQAADIVVRAVSGNIVYSQEGVTANTPVNKLLGNICEHTNNQCEVVQLCAGTEVLKRGQRVGDCLAPPEGGHLELTLLKLPGPALEVQAASGRPMKILKEMPGKGDRCHADRNYTFLSLGDFAERPGMRYVLTCNDDKMTAPDRVMWTLSVRAPMTIYLNFRSEQHVTHTGATAWLTKGDWQREKMKGTVTSGVPNGPYQGPVYSKSVDPGTIELMGSNCGEGTYFVFAEAEAWA